MLLTRYLAALALTLAVEVPLYAGLLRWGWRVRWARAVAVAVGVNLLTHPPLWWLLLPLVGHASYGWFFLAAEVAVCLVEWLLLAAWLRHRFDPLLLVLSIAANASSVLVGLVVLGLIGFAG